MIHAPRGIGKTHISIGAACAVAAGTGFLKWSAPKPRRVLFIDGEMPGAMLQERFARTIDALKADVPPDGFKLVAADLEPDGLPDLASEEGQQFYAEVIAPADLVITDNLSTICRTLRENEADSWGPVQSGRCGYGGRVSPYCSSTTPAKTADSAGHRRKRTSSTPSSRCAARPTTRRARGHGSRFTTRRRAASMGTKPSHSRLG